MRQYILERYELRRVGLDVANRLCESMALVRSEVVLASGVAEDVALERLGCALDDLASTDLSVRFEVRRKHPSVQGLSELQRNCSAAGAYDEAAEATGVRG